MIICCYSVINCRFCLKQDFQDFRISRIPDSEIVVAMVAVANNTGNITTLIRVGANLRVRPIRIRANTQVRPYIVVAMVAVPDNHSLDVSASNVGANIIHPVPVIFYLCTHNS
jgi:hypothetical protein